MIITDLTITLLAIAFFAGYFLGRRHGKAFQDPANWEEFSG